MQKLYKKEQAMVEPLLDWFSENARELPWRENPEPYRVWISEIMLQQTRVEAVKEYYRRFMEELPDVKALAEVEDEHLMKLWEGLGYYSRARNLKKAAQQICSEYGGQLPKEKSELMKLPGIGAYTAGAIASIAYGKRAAAVDGNVLRVMMRFRGSHEDITKNSVKSELEQCIEYIMPEEFEGAFTQSLMELGALVCLPNGAPLCKDCPLVNQCQASKKELWRQIPVKPAKKERRIEEKTVLLLEIGEKVAIRKREEKGLLAGLWEYPSVEGIQTEQMLKAMLKKQGMSVFEVVDFGKAKHIFSHIEWHMQGYFVRLSGDVQDGENQKHCENGSNNIANNAVGDTKHSDIFTNTILVSLEEMQEKYSIPSAFEAYRKRLEQIGKSDK